VLSPVSSHQWEQDITVISKTYVPGTVTYGCGKNVEHGVFLILKLQHYKIFSSYCLCIGNVLTAVMSLSAKTDTPETTAAYK
jgi:hypothetical protein